MSAEQIQVHPAVYYLFAAVVCGDYGDDEQAAAAFNVIVDDEEEAEGKKVKGRAEAVHSV